MTGDLVELHDELRRVARDLLGKTTAGEADWSRAADLGWLGLEVPDALGGAGASFAETAVVLEEMGRAATASSYLGTAVLGVAAIGAAAPQPVSDELLRAVASGDRRIAVALAASGDDATFDPPFRVEHAAGGPRLSGRAEFVADAAEADDLIVLAVGADQAPVLVHIPAAAVTVTRQPVLDATRGFGVVEADGLVLSPSAVWSSANVDEVAQHILDRAAVAIACDSLGLAGAMLDATVSYVGARHQFGRPVGSFQAVKHACADMLVQLSVGRELVTDAVAAVGAGSPDASAAAARAKSFMTAAAVDIAGSAMQLHGGIGYTWESGVHVYLKRAVLNRSLYGAPAAHRRRLVALSPQLRRS